MNKRWLLLISLTFLLLSIGTVSGQGVFRRDAVAKPSPKFKLIRFPRFTLEVPENWNENPWGDFKAYNPPGAYFPEEEQNHMTHGIYFGIVDSKGDLPSTLRNIISADFEANPHLKDRSGFQSAAISRRDAIVANSSGDFAFTGLREIVTYYAVYLPGGGVFHIATDSPEDDYAEYQPIFDRIIESIEFDFLSGRPAAPAAPATADKDYTGYVDVVEVDGSSCRLRIIGPGGVSSGVVTYGRLSTITGRRINSYPQAVSVLNRKGVRIIWSGSKKGNGSDIDFNSVERIEIDDADKPSGPTIVAPPTSGSVINLQTDVLFDFNKSEIKPEAIPVLIELAQYIRDNRIPVVELSGHTDSIGGDAYNLALSERRADAVKKWLVDNGNLEAGRLRTRGYGKRRPVAPNTTPDGEDDPEGRQKNRRVEIRIPK